MAGKPRRMTQADFDHVRDLFAKLGMQRPETLADVLQAPESEKKAPKKKSPKVLKVEHPVHPGLYPPRPMVLEVRECATLGTNFADIYLNDKLYAREVSRQVAETFIRFPDFYVNAFADEAKIRTWLLEKWDAEAVEQLRKAGKDV